MAFACTHRSWCPTEFPSQPLSRPEWIIIYQVRRRSLRTCLFTRIHARLKWKVTTRIMNSIASILELSAVKEFFSLFARSQRLRNFSRVPSLFPVIAYSRTSEIERYQALTPHSEAKIISTLNILRDSRASLKRGVIYGFWSKTYFFSDLAQ